MLSSKFTKSLLLLSYVIRFVLCLWPQYGYIHPDEFFQFTEPAVGGLLSIKWLKTWEFTTLHPIRSVILPHLITSPILLARDWLKIPLDGYAILVIPRIVMTILSFIVDYVVYKISVKTVGWKWDLPALIFSTSFLTISFMTHTLTNSLETILLAITILISVEAITQKKAERSFFLGILLSLGIFNRPTFMVFALLPTMFWMLSGRGNFIRKLVVNSARLVPTFFLTSLLMVTIDTMYYRPFLLEELTRTIDKGPEAVLAILSDEAYLERFASLIVVTPFNFAVYNTKTENLANHGLHNWYHHIFVNVPFVFSIIGLFAYLDAFKVLRGRKSIRSSSPKNMMFLTFWLSLGILSIIAHQEGRFLMPLILCLTYIYGNRFRTRKKLFFLWLAFNAFMSYIYGHVHQAGVIHSLIDVNRIIHSAKNSPIDLIIARSYLPPMTLLKLDQHDRNHRVHDLSIEEDFVNSVQKTLNTIFSKKQKRSVYLAMPSCLSSKLADIVSSSSQKTWFKMVKSYFPHYTFEDIDHSWRILRESFNSGQFVSGLKKAFSFNLYQVFRDIQV